MRGEHSNNVGEPKPANKFIYLHYRRGEHSNNVGEPKPANKIIYLFIIVEANIAIM